jgi:hypothetical protein
MPCCVGHLYQIYHWVSTRHVQMIDFPFKCYFLMFDLRLTKDGLCVCLLLKMNELLSIEVDYNTDMHVLAPFLPAVEEMFYILSLKIFVKLIYFTIIN